MFSSLVSADRYLLSPQCAYTSGQSVRKLAGGGTHEKGIIHKQYIPFNQVMRVQENLPDRSLKSEINAAERPVFGPIVPGFAGVQGTDRAGHQQMISAQWIAHSHHLI